MNSKEFSNSLKDAGVEITIVKTEKSSDRLKQIAKDIYNDKIFITSDIEIMKRNFLVFAFATPDQLPTDAVAVYEYYSNAAPVALNGLPIFLSSYFLNEREANEVTMYIKKIKDAVDCI